MPIGIRDEHEELRLSLRRWCESWCPPSVTREALDAPADALPPFWDELAAQGTPRDPRPRGVRRARGGTGRAAVAAEELGRAAAPGPWATTVVVAAMLADHDAPARNSFRPSSTVRHRRRSSTRSWRPTGAPRTARTGRHPPCRRHDGGRGHPPAVGERHRRQAHAGAGRTGGVDALGAARDGRRDGERGVAELRPRVDLGLVDARGCRGPAAADPDRGDDRADPRPRAAVAVRRSGGRRRLVPRGRRGARAQPPPVRQAHRPVPGREAPSGGHAGADRAVGGSDLGRGHLDGRTVRERGRQRGHGTSPPVGAARRLLVARRLRRSCQRHHPGPRRDGLHLGARRARPPSPGHDAPSAGGRHGAACGPRRPASPSRGRGGRSASSSLPRPTSCRSG